MGLSTTATAHYCVKTTSRRRLDENYHLLLLWLVSYRQT